MKANSTVVDRDISRRNWLKLAAGLGALGLMSSEKTNIVGQVLAQEESQLHKKDSANDNEKHRQSMLRNAYKFN